jgi:hypothetical protein
MTNQAVADYSNAIKWALTGEKLYGGETADWEVGEETKSSDGNIVTEFKNAKQGIVLHVSGQEDADFARFSMKRVDLGSSDVGNFSIPKSFKGMTL